MEQLEAGREGRFGLQERGISGEAEEDVQVGAQEIRRDPHHGQEHHQLFSTRCHLQERVNFAPCRSHL